LLIGLLVANVMNPGTGMNVDPSSLSTSEVDAKTNGSELPSEGDFFLNMIPDSAVGAFSSNSMLQEFLISWFFGITLTHLVVKTAENLLQQFEKVNDLLFNLYCSLMQLQVFALFSPWPSAVITARLAYIYVFEKLFFFI
ncbi:C4-dicarboxylate transporter DctA, partial [Microbacterium testaceum]